MIRIIVLLICTLLMASTVQAECTVLKYDGFEDQLNNCCGNYSDGCSNSLGYDWQYAKCYMPQTISWTDTAAHSGSHSIYHDFSYSECSGLTNYEYCRSEMYWIENPDEFEKGTELWLQFSFRLPDSYSGVGDANSIVIFQVMQNRGDSCNPAANPPIAVSLVGTSELKLSVRGDSRECVEGSYQETRNWTLESSLSKETWHTVIMHVLMDPEGSGFMYCWLDGIQKVAQTGIKVTYDRYSQPYAKPHIKSGLYTWRWKPQYLGDGVNPVPDNFQIWFDDYALGDSDCTYSEFEAITNEEPPPPPPIANIFVDSQLTSDCERDYSIENHDCTAAGTPFAGYNTLQEAITAAEPGDHIYIRGGTWSENEIIIDKTVTIEAYGNEEPIIDNNQSGGGNGNWTKIIGIKAPDVTISGLTLREDTFGIIANNGANAIIKNCTFNDFWRGALRIYASNNVTIQDNKIYNNGLSGTSGFPAVHYLYGSDNGIVNGNMIADSDTEGVIIGPVVSGTSVYSNKIYGCLGDQILVQDAYGCSIHHNLVYGTTHGTGRGIDLVYTVANGNISYNGHHTIWGNLVANTAINLRLEIDGEIGANLLENNLIYNNTFVGATTTSISIEDDATDGNIIKNNIFKKVAETAYTVLLAGGPTFGHNVWSEDPGSALRGINDPGYPTYESQNVNLKKTSGWNSLVGNDLDILDFTLSSGNDAIDAGENLGPSYSGAFLMFADQDEYGTAWEIGAVIFPNNE